LEEEHLSPAPSYPREELGGRGGGAIKSHIEKACCEGKFYRKKTLFRFSLIYTEELTVTSKHETCPKTYTSLVNQRMGANSSSQEIATKKHGWGGKISRGTLELENIDQCRI